MRTLVVGCDASGKTTMLHEISERYGDIQIESTRSPRAIAFKHASFGRTVDASFVDERESLYLSLGEEVMRQTNQANLASKNTVSSDATLVTRLSHGIMRTLIQDSSFSNDAIVGKWREDEEKYGISIPDVVILTSPPFEIIKERMIQRQKSGQRHEEFKGFNSLHFLEAYYNGWLSVFSTISEMVHSSVIIDTSLITPQESLEVYAQYRPPQD